MVVYASHGAGHVAARERRVVLGKRQEVIVLALAGGLSVELPMERARELLRPLASEADMSRVQKTLGGVYAVSGDPWLKRRRDLQAKLTGGDAVGLAEIIRDSARREWTLPAKGAKSQLAPGEKELFVKARQLLSNEIALARRPAGGSERLDRRATHTNWLRFDHAAVVDWGAASRIEVAVAFPTNRDRAQVELVTHGRAFYA
jgi:RNA polymerase-interacting CarD/CdnL/TRCF family regulator